MDLMLFLIGFLISGPLSLDNIEYNFRGLQTCGGEAQIILDRKRRGK